MTTTEQTTGVNRDRIRLLVTALRSEHYRGLQVRGVLATVGDDGLCRFCALGVAIEVAIDNGLEGVRRRSIAVDGPFEQVNYETYEDDMITNIYASALPSSVVEWYGLDYPYGGVMQVNGYGLDYWNDNGETFIQIADRVEAEFLHG